MAVPELTPHETEYGLVADGDGWFVINAKERRWDDTGPFGRYCNFEGEHRFPQLGINLNVLQPGQSLGLYHREPAQEGFLVLAGECLLLVEGEERTLRAWDFFHSPGGTDHIIVGAGEGPSVVLAVGGRGEEEGLVYPVEALAQAHGVSADEETTKPAEAYRRFPRWTPCRYEEGWLPDLRVEGGAGGVD